jgi:diguanylate cyclase (GGDEF)-like protein
MPPANSSKPPKSSPREAGRSDAWTGDDVTARSTAKMLSAAPVSRHAARAIFTVLDGLSAGAVHAVTGKRMLIGRSREADLHLEDAGISRRHARVIVQDEETVGVENLGSRNGTFVNDVRVETATLKSGDLLQLGPNVTLAFAIIDRRAEELARKTYESSIRDSLTQAFNRRYLLARLTSEIAYAIRHATQLGAIIFDLDNFKRVNDSHGHLAGDDVLRDVAALVLRTIRVEDVFARLGGEEFVVLVRGGQVELLAERLRAAIAKLVVATADTTLQTTISAGYASLSELTELSLRPTAESLMRLADQRLYRAKDLGRNRVFGG